MAGKEWSYKNFQINEGWKPQTKHAQYYFVVSEKGKKKCNYCVWIDDEYLRLLAGSGSVDKVISLKGKEWTQWVQSKIDEGDYRNLVLKVDKNGQEEIDLDQLDQKLELE